MSQIRLTIPAPRSSAKSGAVFAGPGVVKPEGAGTVPERLRLQLLDANVLDVGEPFEMDMPNASPVEGRGEGGTPEWSFATAPLSLALELPAETEMIRVQAKGAAPWTFRLNAVRSRRARPPDMVRRFLDATARWTLAVVSERFADADEFFDHCATLGAFIQSEAPFGDEGVSFGIIGLFWACPIGETLFGASDDRIQGRVLQGDGASVRKFVAAANVTSRKTLVLVNSMQRAGAGGFGRDVPSWTTITAEPSERWEGVALHELGHAFGLADEYDQAFDLAEPDPLEPNVSREADPDATAWRHLCTVHAPPAPTGSRGSEADHDVGTVGTFQGARYRSDRFRPSPDCRMRTTTVPFCAVCREQIQRELTG